MSEYTIKDIARMVGVSTGTVSRVLNNADNIDPELYRRTMEVIRSTNYKQGSRGRRPGQRHNSGATLPERNTIAVISPEMSPAWKTNELWSSYMAGIERACRERHFHLVMYMAGGYSSEETMVGDIFRRSSGVLLKTGSRVPDYIGQLAGQMPVVGFGAYNPSCRIPQVALDNHAAGMIVTERLLRMGHRRIAFVNRELHSSIFVSRSHGYMEVMKREGAFIPELLLESGAATYSGRSEPQSTPPDMTDILAHLLSLPEPPTAVIFANDWMAFGFYKACQAREIRIPEDFSVAGIDDVGSLCEVLSPTLASVAMPFELVAYFAACNLFDMLNGVGRHTCNVASVQYLPGELHERASIKVLS